MPDVQGMMRDVERFNREIIGLPIPETPTRLSEGRKKHAYDHLHEELTEFWLADTLEEEVDACLDLAYVALGRVLEMGVPAGAAFEEVQRANMERVRGKNSKRGNAAGFDAVKPEGWRPPDLRPYLEVTRDQLLAAQQPKKPDTRRVVGVRPRPKILILGYGRHGKDTVAEMLRDDYGLSFVSSSEFCAEHVVLPWFNALWQRSSDLFYERTGRVYPWHTWQDCYADRHKGMNRKNWYDAITEFNRPDASQLGRAIFAEHDIYCGLRSSREFHAVKAAGLYDLCVWVDASGRGVLPEDRSSCTVEPWMADHVVDNSGDVDELRLNVRRLMASRFNMEPRS